MFLFWNVVSPAVKMILLLFCQIAIASDMKKVLKEILKGNKDRKAGVSPLAYARGGPLSFPSF